MRIVVDNFHYGSDNNPIHSCPLMLKAGTHKPLDGVNTSFAENVNSLIFVFKRSIHGMSVERARVFLSAIIGRIIRDKVEVIMTNLFYIQSEYAQIMERLGPRYNQQVQLASARIRSHPLALCAHRHI